MLSIELRTRKQNSLKIAIAKTLAGDRQIDGERIRKNHQIDNYKEKTIFIYNFNLLRDSIPVNLNRSVDFITSPMQSTETYNYIENNFCVLVDLECVPFKCSELIPENLCR